MTLRFAGLSIVLGAMIMALTAFETRAAPSGDVAEPAQQRRTRVQVRPRNKPGPNSVRQCRSNLVQEHRLSGTVIVPRMYCWWE